ncbi:MAG TPA: hypothetical protein VFQ51_06950, partial [Vicinamibacteria bacterium]|nr:hypothetical protein [Vicinamibacteria bacterium]
MTKRRASDRTGREDDGPIPPDEPVAIDWTRVGSGDDPVVHAATGWLSRQRGARRAAMRPMTSVLLLLAVAVQGRADEAWTVDRLLATVEREAAARGSSPAVRRDFEELAGRQSLRVSDDGFRTYVRVKSIFEASREAGWWRIAWNVTNREPQSDAIWSAWRGLGTAVPRVTAVAECDESAALAAVLLRHMKVR